MIIISIIGFSFNIIIGIVLAKSGVPHRHRFHNHPHEHEHHDDQQHDSDVEEIVLHDENEHEHKNTNVNNRASFIHVLGDAFQNVGMFIAGGIIFFFSNFSIADPIYTYIYLVLLWD